jgi:hypothetical protein
MKPPVTRRWALWGTLLGLSVAAIWWCWRQSFPPTVRLADGRAGFVRAVTYGTNHVFVDGPLWVRMLGRYLPRALSARRGMLRHTWASPHPSTVVWMEWEFPATNRPPGLAAVVDRHGIVSESKFYVVSAMAQTHGLVAWCLENYPRREKNIRLKFYSQNFQAASHVDPAGELVLPNPARRASSWSAPAAPASGDGAQTFALRSLFSGSATGMPFTNRYGPRALATFQVLEAGRTNSLWAIRGLEGRGASGNFFRSHWAAAPETPLFVGFLEILWPDEPDWRLRVEFTRMTGFPAEDLVTIKAINAVLTNPPFTTNLQLVVNGVTLDSVELRGTRQIRRSWARDAYRPNADFALVFHKPPGMQVDLVRMTDESGRNVRFADVTQPTPSVLEASVEVLPSCRSVDVTLAVHKSRLAEFLVRPDWDTSRWATAYSAFSQPRETINKRAR